MSIYKWCDEPQDNYFAEPSNHGHGAVSEEKAIETAMDTEGGRTPDVPQQPQQARRSPSPISSESGYSERAQMKVSPATQKR